MAMLDEFGPSSAEMRETFERAAKTGPGFMLLISEILDDPMLVTIYNTTACVSSDAEILPLLKRQATATCYGDIRLAGVFDLTKSYNDQINQPLEHQIKTLLSAGTRDGIKAMEDARHLKYAYQEWANLPWYERLFKPKPV